ncbi:MAG TPA: HEAT repeat domain-containing protein [Flavisolibacter sp.]|nr:HEAT repeat domain-containing protein [Flavisolibacter sp.]
MAIAELLADKSKKTKEKAEIISHWLLTNSLSIDDLIQFTKATKEIDKATCIEALAIATKQDPKIADEAMFVLVTKMLNEAVPRVKWESARVIGNVAYLFPAKLSKAIPSLLINSGNNGTVVRWASAYALGEILKLKTKHNNDLLPAIEAICESEEDNGVKKKYLDAIKKTKK